MPSCSLQTTVTWSCCVHALGGSDHAASFHCRQLCGTISHLNWRTMTLAEHCYKSGVKTWLFECVYCASVTKQYNLVLAKEWLCFVAGKVSIGLALIYPPTGSWPNEGRWAPCLCSCKEAWSSLPLLTCRRRLWKHCLRGSFISRHFDWLIHWLIDWSLICLSTGSHISCVSVAIWCWPALRTCGILPSGRARVVHQGLNWWTPCKVSTSALSCVVSRYWSDRCKMTRQTTVRHLSHVTVQLLLLTCIQLDLILSYGSSWYTWCVGHANLLHNPV